jgi:hypothetical protein
MAYSGTTFALLSLFTCMLMIIKRLTCELQTLTVSITLLRCVFFLKEEIPLFHYSLFKDVGMYSSSSKVGESKMHVNFCLEELKERPLGKPRRWLKNNAKLIINN